MKRCVLGFIFSMAGFIVFAQQLPTVAVATFDTIGGVTKDEAQVITELFMAELVSKGTVNVVDRVNFDKIIAEMKFQTSDWSNNQKTAALGKALNAQYVIRGQVMKMSDRIYWTATMLDINTAQVLYSSREQLSNLGEAFDKLPTFCDQMLNKIPAPNYFVGIWKTGGRKSSHGGWGSSGSANPYDFPHGYDTVSDDALKEVIMNENGNCIITTQSDERMEGSYAYDYNRPYFSLSAGSYKIEGELFLNSEKTQFYILYNISSYTTNWGRDGPWYKGYFKSLVKSGS
jgi:TolB-like protein